jgi:2-methylcitrate dehydratase
MSVHLSRNAERPAPDLLLTEIADYVLGRGADSVEARRIARYCLMDTLGCGILALGFPACTKLLGPVVPGCSAWAAASWPRRS